MTKAMPASIRIEDHAKGTWSVLSATPVNAEGPGDIAVDPIDARDNAELEGKPLVSACVEDPVLVEDLIPVV